MKIQSKLSEVYSMKKLEVINMALTNEVVRLTVLLENLPEGSELANDISSRISMLISQRDLEPDYEEFEHILTRYLKDDNPDLMLEMLVMLLGEDKAHFATHFFCNVREDFFLQANEFFHDLAEEES